MTIITGYNQKMSLVHAISILMFHKTCCTHKSGDNM